ncbi:hypothetical protein KSF_038560 [Reticulibacter mediterranei]|uniref:TIR domain-containing protein n=1 Tax=Reticulibacter mediterranei TaxID=2778369 RepID=A0A8J3IJW6_9CHLR|nr:tetratricopeptide repeat protein [Reticulibacter mediterranei]GHO93808.1 hypothetical protein KSF_038560 [Reticulibacter mediterranei]
MSVGSEAEKKSITIYYSCANSQVDQTLVHQLDRHLVVLRREGKITTWQSAQAGAGLPVEQERTFYFEKAQIILLLISPDYFEEDSCLNEMQLALYRKATAGIHVIPVLLRLAPGWKLTAIGDLRALPYGERPITSWTHREEAYASIADEIYREVMRLLDLRRPTQVTRGVIRTEPPPHQHKTAILQRESVVSTVYTKLIQPDVSAVVLTGIKGIGKSTLAAQVYSYAEERRRAGEGLFTSEALWLRIEASGTITDLIRVVAVALKTSHDTFDYSLSHDWRPVFFNPHLNLAVELFHLLKHESTPRLIVLDQFEEWLDDHAGREPGNYAEISEWLDMLNSQACACRILLTAHTYPQGTGVYHQIYRREHCVEGLHIPEGVALLRQWGVQDDEKHLTRAIQHCEGHLLALVLLDQLRQKHHVDLATLLDNPRYKRLWIKDVKRNLWDYIYEHLLKNENQLHLLLAFSIYREAVPWHAAYTIIHRQTRVTEEEALIALEAIQDYKLLNISQVEEEYYALHPLIADFLRNHSTTNDDANRIDIRKAHAEAARYYQDSFSIYEKPYQRIEDMHALIEAVWHLCKAEKYQEAYALMEQKRLFFHLHRWGDNAPLSILYELLLSSEQLQEETERFAQIHNELGEVYNGLGYKYKAQDCFEKSLSLYKSIGAREGEVKALNNLGSIYRADGQIEQALKYYQEALHLGEKMPECTEQGVTLNNLGRALQSQGQAALASNKSHNSYYQQALAYYKQALIIHKATGDTAEIARTRNNLGEAYSQLYQFGKALDHYRRALQNFREIGERRGEGITCNNLGVFYRMCGQEQDSLEYYMQALRIFREIGDRWQEGIVLRNIGQLHVLVQRNDVALACFLLAKDIFEALHYPQYGAITEELQLRMANGQPFESAVAEIYPRANQIIEAALSGNL